MPCAPSDISSEVTRFQLSSPTKIPLNIEPSVTPNQVEGRMMIKQENCEEEFISPCRPGQIRTCQPLTKVGRGPCSIQKVPSLSDLSDPESSSSL
ncbi:unnamed protein product, partial [Allacma fusca]